MIGLVIFLDNISVVHVLVCLEQCILGEGPCVGVVGGGTKLIFFLFTSVEKAGGHCLPCVVDIREESQVEKAVSDAVARFGGIDILVNNASAIHLTGTVDTPMKRY